MAAGEQIDFTFNWRALELLGRGLYSNPWSAISELVANGFDAKATEVLVYIDLRNKKNATVEIIDNGSGMSREDIEVYVQVGHDKRAAAGDEGADRSDTTYMGRKGIGKLAALYLSSLVTISTKTASSHSVWVLDARRESRGGAEQFPHLTETPNEPDSICSDLWDQVQKGTRIHLSGVDLTRMGERTTASLKQLLANQFITGSGVERSIKVWVQMTALDAAERAAEKFVEAQRQVAFKNMAFIEYNFTKRHPDPDGIEGADFVVEFPPRDPGRKAHTHKVVTRRFNQTPLVEYLWPGHSSDLDIENQTYKGHKYTLAGWVGIHATIRNEQAEKNDSRFVRNATYNPAQIRLYVRGKLASDRLLSQLGLTRQYLNYIEGELSFDLLDADKLEDIATASRQDFDETDDRVALLRALVRPVVQRLISHRQRLMASHEGEDERAAADARARAKSAFSDQLGKDLSGFSEISESARDQIQLLAVNKLHGEVEIKQDYMIFFSHSSKDSAFVNFIYELLCSRGAEPEEIFYTSRPHDASRYGILEALQAQIKSTIKAKNTLLFYLTSDHFMGSQYCMFEGGAGWITRSVGEYALLSTRFRDVPEFLTNGKMEMSLVSGESIDLRPELHQYLIDLVLNPMIDHLNRGREIAEKPLIARFESVSIPLKAELIERGLEASDYFDAEVVRHWDAHVSPIAAEYVASLIKRDRKRR